MKELNTPFHFLVKLIKVYQLREGDAFWDVTAIAAKCEVEAIVWTCVGESLYDVYDVLFDFERSTPTRLIFDVDENDKDRGRGNTPPPASYRIVVTDGEVNFYGNVGTSPPHNTSHITDVFQTLFAEMK
jgi:hypothetical protein